MGARCSTVFANADPQRLQRLTMKRLGGSSRAKYELQGTYCRSRRTAGCDSVFFRGNLAHSSLSCAQLSSLSPRRKNCTGWSKPLSLRCVSGVASPSFAPYTYAFLSEPRALESILTLVAVSAADAGTGWSAAETTAALNAVIAGRSGIQHRLNPEAAKGLAEQSSVPILNLIRLQAGKNGRDAA